MKSSTALFIELYKNNTTWTSQILYVPEVTLSTGNIALARTFTRYVHSSAKRRHWSTFTSSQSSIYMSANPEAPAFAVARDVTAHLQQRLENHDKAGYNHKFSMVVEVSEAERVDINMNARIPSSLYSRIKRVRKASGLNDDFSMPAFSTSASVYEEGF